MAKDVITFCSKGFLRTTALLVMVIANSMVFSDRKGWEEAFATFYGDRSGGETRKGACGYDDTLSQGYGLQTTALSTALFNDGLACGTCYQIRCHNDPKWCLPGMVVAVSATNFCPPNWSKPSGKGGWCNPPRKHFDLSMPAFLRIGMYKGGIIPVLYRRIPCVKKGGIRFEIKSNSNPYWIAVLVFNVGGAGDVRGVRIKGTNTDWITMSRNWGQVWQTGIGLLGQGLSFEVTAGDGRVVRSNNVASSNWYFGQTFEGKQF